MSADMKSHQTASLNASNLVSKIRAGNLWWHNQTEMLRQRIYQIIAGFEDADDYDRLCRDGLRGAEAQLHIL